MLRRAHGLTAEELEAIAALEARVVAHDGGRLKLEWARLRGRDGSRAEDVLAFDGDRLVGFAGLYGPGDASIEIAGMVDPDARRRGIGAALLAEALALVAERGAPAPLLIVPRASAGGRVLAERHGGALDHSEHALALHGEPPDGPADPALSLRDARREDVAGITRVWSSAFGWAPADLGEQLTTPGRHTIVIERDGRLAGTLGVARDGERASVFGFAVDPALQGRGIGRDALRRACRQLRAGGATVIGLEVEIDNDRALGLYTSLGFEPVITEDYWRLESVSSVSESAGAISA